MPEGLRESPWDTAVFGFDCYEISDYREDLLAYAAAAPGHFTIKLDPLSDKGLLHRYGFYYTDTLLEPVCRAPQLLAHAHADVGITSNAPLEDVLRICRTAFTHGRFHRDFNLPHAQADHRYVQWLEQMHGRGEVIGLLFEGKLAGFIAHASGALLLHAVDEAFRGKGLSKYLWSAACLHLFAQGEAQLKSSISAANLPVLNLYASLGFRYASAVDVYHRLNRPA